MKRRTFSAAPLGAATCEACPHDSILLASGTLWCPCEDCHPGGHVQGKGAKPVAQTQTRAAAKPESSEPEWLDPIHRL
jgi:hypothetical protein